MTEGMAKVSPGPKALTAGVVYMLYFLSALSGEFFLRGVLVHGNAAATISNILAHPSTFRLSLAASLVSVACYVALTGLLYRLFGPVNRSVSFTAALFSLVGCSVLAFAGLFRAAPLVVSDGQYLTGFQPEQLRMFTLLSFDLYGQCVEICFVFFGIYCLLIGYLIFQSHFLPRFLGVWMMLAGVGWLFFLVPPLAHRLRTCIVGVGFFGEFVLMLWLLLRGVDVRRWKELEEGR